MNGAFIAPIFNKHHEYVAVSSNQPDSLRAGGARRVGNAAILSSPRSLWLKAFANISREGGTGVHAPGLSFSVRRDRVVDVDTGLRTRRRGVAARSSRGICQHSVVACRARAGFCAAKRKPRGPVLAMLQVEPPAAEEKAPDQVPAVMTPAEQPATSAMPAEPEETAKPAEPEIAATPTEPEVTAKQVEPEVAATPAGPEVTAEPSEPERTAGLEPEKPPEPKTAEPEIPVAESPAQQEAAPAQAVAPAATDETKMATPASASEEVSPVASEATSAAAEQASSPASADADIASTKIATLGGPPVTIEAAPPAKSTVAKHDRNVIKKRVEARRSARHRRTALRARVVQQIPQQPADPFGQPFAAARRR